MVIALVMRSQYFAIAAAFQPLAPRRSHSSKSESGGRMIDAILTNTMLPDISRQFLTRMMEGNEIAGVTVDVGNGDFAYNFA